MRLVPNNLQEFYRLRGFNNKIMDRDFSLLEVCNPIRIKKKEKGFTLLETLVTVAIIIILTGIVFGTHRTGQQQLILQRATNKVAQDVRRAQGMALAAEKFHGAVPKGGYGVSFTNNTTSYILFADCNNDQFYNQAFLLCDDCSVTPCTPNVFSEKLEEIELEKGVTITLPLSLLHMVTFTPPDPIITLYPLYSIPTIQLSIGGQQRTIKINETGMIDIE